MALVERDEFMTSLQAHFENVVGGEGHCILLSGEAGIGKTALVKAFCKKQAGNCTIYQGACDGLFTPRPLAPLYDILWQVSKERWPFPPYNEERSVLFASLLQELSVKKGKFLMVFEDIHWADEGTLDFIRFFVRRIYQLPCLFILTYRNDEIYSGHSLRNVLGQLPPDSFTKMVLTPLSKQAVMEMATKKGYSGEDVYSISEGNPFYVNEILASYSPGVPDNIKDAILCVYESQAEGTKNAWQIFSVIPEGLEVERFAKIKSSWFDAMDHCFAMSVLVVQKNKVVFKHELYRRTIEESLSPNRRIELNKMVLKLFLDSLEENGEIERIIHYAKNANEKQLVGRYAPEAARKAASAGAHKEAAKLFLTAIDYFEGSDAGLLAEFYEAYAHECYLSNQLKEAIHFTEKLLSHRKATADTEKTADCLRYLSWLCWFDGKGKLAEEFAGQAFELLNDRQLSRSKAMAFSNKLHLKIQKDELNECIQLGEKELEMANELNDKELISCALNNWGTAQLFVPRLRQNGMALLQQSLDLALGHAYHEQVALVYINLGNSLVRMKEYAEARKILGTGVRYCEERDLNCWTAYFLSLKARMELETGNWGEAWNIADNLLRNEHQPAITKITPLIIAGRLKMRKGEDALELLMEAKDLSFKTMELQRILPSLVGLLEYEWLSSQPVIEKNEFETTNLLLQRGGIEQEKKEFDYWMRKSGRNASSMEPAGEAYDCSSVAKALKASDFWEKSGCPFEQALFLFEAGDEDKRKAMAMMQDLGATTVHEKFKQEMRNLGIRNIPRGLRSSTRSNAAFLTGREMDVLQLLKEDLQNKEIAAQLYISAKTVDHHISSILFKLEATTRSKAVSSALRRGILK